MGIKYSINESFFEKWTPKMAYVLGYIYADGSLEDASYLRGKYVRVSSTDRSSIERIRGLLKSEHKIVDIKPRVNYYKFQKRSYKSKPSYLLRIGSHALYDSLIKFGLYPNKSLTVKFPTIPDNVLNHFVRGYFDGDGCVCLEIGSGITKEKIVKRLAVIFTSGSFDFLDSLQKRLEKNLQLKGKIYQGNRAYRLRYSTGDAVKLFSFMYTNSKDLFLERKFNIFIRYFELRPTRTDNIIRAIIKRISYK